MSAEIKAQVVEPQAPKDVAVITMSVRNPRAGPKVASFVLDTLAAAAEGTSVALRAVDLADFKLPVFDEAVHPAMVPATAQFAHEHSRRWSAEVASHDGFVLVVPEYNYGLAGGTKNAIDYLYNEWKGKPVAVVSYGIHGGAKASDQAAQVLAGVGLRLAGTRPQLGWKGGAGADLQLALGEGGLGDETRREWEGQVPTIRKAFEEVLSLLNEAPNEEAKE